jgi:ADP-ribosylglycohydrolase
MRTGVLGVLVRSSADARREATFADAAITHFDPKCQLACAAFNASIGLAVLADAAPAKGDLIAAAEVELALAADVLRARHADLRTEIDAAQAALVADLAAARADDPELYGTEINLQRMAGFVRVAFRLAYWQLLHAPTITAALIDVANRGGDADTNAAITGALYGAYAGIDALPGSWIDRVRRAPGLPAAGGTLHPRAFFDHVDGSLRE